MLNVVKIDPLFTDEQIEKIEDYYKAKFICETCLKLSSDNWMNTNFAVFYQEDPPEIAKSNYFALYYNREGNLMITDASSSLEPFEGLLINENEILYSRYRHDYKTYEDYMVDGGRDYMRFRPSASAKVVKLQIVKDQLEIVDD